MYSMIVQARPTDVLFYIMVNDLTAANPGSNLLVKYADDITLSVPVRSGAVDQSQAEVNNIQCWATENRMRLNLKKTWEMILRGKTKTPLPEPLPDIKRKKERKLLGVTFNKHPCNWDTYFDQMIPKGQL